MTKLSIITGTLFKRLAIATVLMLFTYGLTVCHATDINNCGSSRMYYEANQTSTVFKKKYGEPLESEEFKLGKGVPEFRVELLNYFPLPENEDLTIKELTWKDDQCMHTVWFTQKAGEWRSVHHLVYEEDTDF